MSDSQQVFRQWLVIKMLSSTASGVTVKELAAEANTSEKTIRRDLATLQEIGFPIEEQTGEFNRKTWRIDSKWARTDLSFQFDEALALYVGQRTLEPLAGTLLWQAMQNAFRKIRAALGRPALKYLDKMAGQFHRTSVGAGDYSRKAEILDELLMGIEESRVVFITYQSAQATEPVTYDIHPYGISFHRDSLYLVGFAPQHGELRHWKVDRIERAEKDAMPFTRPDDFDIQKHFAHSFGVFHGSENVTVRIRFAPTVARYVTESRWHASQKLTPQPDGSLLAEFTLSNTVEIRSWVLSFGATAEVLEPPTLREQIAEELRQMLTKYKQEKPQTTRLPAKRRAAR